MNQPYMGQIVSGLKTFEFRKYRIAENVQRVWFYVTAPESRISHVCDIDAARTRTEGDEPLPLNGLGNKEFNERHPDWNGYDYAYEIKAVYQLTLPLGLKVMKEKYGWKGAPRGLVYVTPEMAEAFPLEEQIKVLPKDRVSDTHGNYPLFARLTDLAPSCWSVIYRMTTEKTDVQSRISYHGEFRNLIPEGLRKSLFPTAYSTLIPS
jgi:predicted transcriptional regulator